MERGERKEGGWKEGRTAAAFLEISGEGGDSGLSFNIKRASKEQFNLEITSCYAAICSHGSAREGRDCSCNVWSFCVWELTG